MAESASRARNRLFRTYGAGAGCKPQRLASRAAVQWFSPKDRKRVFSSSSGLSSPSVASDDPDDPDFQVSPVQRRRRDRGAPGRQTRLETPRRRGQRPGRPQKCSTPCGPCGPPPLPERLRLDLDASGRASDADELGTSASLFGSPASHAASAAHGGCLHPRASPGLASLPCLQEAAAQDDGGLSRMVRRAGASLRSAFITLVDSGNPEDPEFGTDDGKNVESGRERPRVRNGRRGPGLAGRGKRASGRGCGHKSASRGAAHIDQEEAGASRGVPVPGRIGRPKRTQPRRKRKRREAAQTPGLRYHRSEKKGRDSLSSQEDLHSQNWARTRASLRFHKKKIVTDVSELCSRALGESFLSEYSTSSAMNRTNSSAVSPWHSSSMYLLSPLKTLHAIDKKASDAEKVYGECNQEGPVPFSCCLSTEKLKHCEKVGEGVFGEVFQIISDHTPVALKIIAIEGPDLVNGSHQKTFEEILPEIIISKELSLLSNEMYNCTQGFIGLNSVHCVQGSYPPLLLKAWDHYNSTKGSENDRPDFFPEDQLFILLEFEFGGVDLEQMRTQLSSIATAKSILHQITASLAVAESSLHFEHRDLHWGNVLLKKTNLKRLQYTLNGQTNTIPTCGLQVNIIDYTLSRLERDGIVVFCDISSDEDLFTGEGDYQFEIYRLMRKENNNCWGEYRPYNNVLWLHYLTDKILNQMSFKRSCQTTAMKQVKKKLQHFHRTVLNFSSATDLLCQHSLFK